MWHDDDDRTLMLGMFAEVVVDEMMDDGIDATTKAAGRIMVHVAERRLREFEQRMLKS
jgi:hypothetical protein